MLYYFNYYIEEGILPASYIDTQTILVKPNKNEVSIKVLKYLCDSRDCGQYMIT